MANGYAQMFTLRDIFNNKDLADKIPLVNYNEKEDEAGKLHRTTKMATLTTFVYNTAKASAKAHYKPLKAVRSGDYIEIGGTLITDIDKAYDGIYGAIKGAVKMMQYTVNNADMIRSAVKEAAKLRTSNGKEPKLWLKIGSMNEIKTMGKRELDAFMDDVMRNLFYDDAYANTQKKFDVKNIAVSGSFNYERRRENWKRKVGEL